MFKNAAMMKRNLALLVFILAFYIGYGQQSLELGSVIYHPRTKGKTLEYLEIPSIKNQFLFLLDSISRKYISLPLSYPENFRIEADPQKMGSLNFKTGGFPNLKTVSNTSPKNKAFLSFDIAELPLFAEVGYQDWDSTLLADLAKKQNICFYQFNAKIISGNATVLMDKKLITILSLTEKAGNIGFYQPEYYLSAAGFIKMIQSCLPVLLDSTNKAELMQISARPALVNDNFIQPAIRNQPRVTGNINKGIIQYFRKGSNQYLRYHEPGYEPIVLKGKKATPLPVNLQQAIRAEQQSDDYIFLWEESRDIVADKNYKLLTIATVAKAASDGSAVLVNNTAHLPFKFLKGNFHKLLQNNDTIATFSIEEQVTDAEKKKMYHQLINPYDTTILTVSNYDRSVSQFYTHVLTGKLLDQPFKILNSDLHGIESIREIYLNDKLVCIAQGANYPEIFTVLDTAIYPEQLNQLLLMAFSSLF